MTQGLSLVEERVDALNLEVSLGPVGESLHKLLHILVVFTVLLCPEHELILKASGHS